jgi:hypothetical protein
MVGGRLEVGGPQTAFLPAAAEMEYERNHDYLLKVLEGCTFVTRTRANGCGFMSVFVLE